MHAVLVSCVYGHLVKCCILPTVTRGVVHYVQIRNSVCSQLNQWAVAFPVALQALYPSLASLAKVRGTVSLRSKNPYDKPVVDCRWMGDPHDRAMIVEVGRGMSCESWNEL